MFINSLRDLIKKLSRRGSPECQLSCRLVGTDPKIDARIFGRAADSKSFSLSSKVLSYSIFPPCPKTTTPPSLKVRPPRKRLCTSPPQVACLRQLQSPQQFQKPSQTPLQLPWLPCQRFQYPPFSHE